MKRSRHVVAAACLAGAVVVSARGARAQRAMDPRVRDEASVYRGILGSTSDCQKLMLDRTEAMDLSRHAGAFRALKDPSFAIDPEARRSFVVSNRQGRVKLTPSDYPAGVLLVRYDKTFDRPKGEAWDKRWPNACSAVIGVSRVGFSADHGEALVYYAVHQGCGTGWLVRMRWSDVGWREEGRRQTFIECE